MLSLNLLITQNNKTQFVISDVGTVTWEEINLAGSDYAAADYGFPVREGPCWHGQSEACKDDSDANRTEPMHFYLHDDASGGCVSAAAFVARGPAKASNQIASKPLLSLLLRPPCVRLPSP